MSGGPAGRDPASTPGHPAIHDDVAALAGGRGPLMGLDLGTKTIGIAVSDGLRLSATGIETLARTKFTADAEALAGHIAYRGIVGIVLGMPRNMDGSAGPRAQSTRAFARNLAARGIGPIAYWDERLSTVAAEKTLLAADSTRKRRGQVIDKLAATIILQGALDRLAAIARATETDSDSDPAPDEPR